MPIYIIKELKKNNYCKSTKYYKKDEEVFTFFYTIVYYPPRFFNYFNLQNQPHPYPFFG